jgi:hypothetical protein
VKEQQASLDLKSLEGVNKLVAKEMIANQDSHFKNEIAKLESMISNNDFGSIYVQKSNFSNNTKSLQVPVATPQMAAPSN